MNISIVTLRDMAPERWLSMDEREDPRNSFNPSIRGKIDLATAHMEIKANYCGPATVRGTCPMECSQCKARILRMLQLDDAFCPPKLLAWIARQELASMSEEKSEKEKVRTTDGEGDPFLAILGDL